MKHRFFETTEEKRVDFFFHHKTQHEFSSHDLSFEKRKRDEKRKIFLDEGSQKVKKLVFCGVWRTEEEEGKREREKRLTQKQHKTEGRERKKKETKNYASSTSVWVLREEGDEHLNVDDDDDGCDGRRSIFFFVFAEKKLSRRRVSVVVDSRRTPTISTPSIDGSFCNIFIFIVVFCFCFGVGREDETDVYFFFLG